MVGVVGLKTSGLKRGSCALCLGFGEDVVSVRISSCPLDLLSKAMTASVCGFYPLYV